MTFRVTLSETAARQLRKLPSDQRNRVVRGLRVLEEDPFRPRPRADIRPIEGTDPRNTASGSETTARFTLSSGAT